MRRKLLTGIPGILFSTLIIAQSVGINNTTPHASAILDVKSSTKGILIPRTSTTSRTAIVSPAKRLMIYDTTTSSFWFYNGSAWTVVANGNNTWGLAGNTAINPSNQFIGTTDAQPLRIRINNTWAGELNPTSGNVFIGIGAGQLNITGASNTAIGKHSLALNTDGNFNTAYGYETLSANTSGISNTAVGSGALFSNTLGSLNTANGHKALYSNITGNQNTATGIFALFNNTTGNKNTANGVEALLNNTTGNENTATGFEALYFNTGSSNTATGANALAYNTTGNKNTAAGVDALRSNTYGIENTATGFEALYFNTGNYNTATGVDALGLNTEGSGNTANGYKALFSNTESSYNTATGYVALYQNTGGHDNTAYGFGALYFNTMGSNNIAIGANSGTGGPNAWNLFNTIGIGNDGLFLNGQSNQVVIGNASTVFIGGKVNWGIVSDARIKNSVEEDVKGLSFILKLRPVTYHISNKAIADLTGNKDTSNFPGKNDGEKIRYTGFLAQEVEQAAKATGYDFSGYTAPKNPWEMYTIRYAEFVVPLVKAMQEQQLIIESLRIQVDAAKAEFPMQIGKQQEIIATQQKQIDMLEKRLAALEAK